MLWAARSAWDAGTTDPRILLVDGDVASPLSVIEAGSTIIRATLATDLADASTGFPEPRPPASDTEKVVVAVVGAALLAQLAQICLTWWRRRRSA